jgi:hypothetical protein
VAALILGYFVLTTATLLYGGLFYIALIGFREAIPGVSQGPLDFIRHVILVSGLLPWLLTATWVTTLHSGGDVPKGLGLIVLSICVHYVVAAVSAHDDVAYPWFQGVEILFAAYSVRWMIRAVRKSPSNAS